MGMFDEIRCNYPLPIALPASVEWFQTKDLVCWLKRFEITSDGHLVELSDEPGDWSDYHADLHFYTNDVTVVNPTSGQLDYYERLEFVARFTDGKVMRIRLVERTKPSPGDHAEELAEGLPSLEELVKQIQNTPSNPNNITGSNELLAERLLQHRTEA